jgi:hypothetical protein
MNILIKDTNGYEEQTTFSLFNCVLSTSHIDAVYKKTGYEQCNAKNTNQKDHKLLWIYSTTSS